MVGGFPREMTEIGSFSGNPRGGAGLFALTGETQPDRYLEKDGIGTPVAKCPLTAHNQDSRYRRFSLHFCREIEIEIHSAWESTHRFQIQGEFPRFPDSV